MYDSKVGKTPINLWSAESVVWNIHRGHLPRSDHSPGVKLIGDVKVRRQTKELGKLSKPNVEPLTICHPHKDSLFLIKEESGVELCDDLLVLVVLKWQKVGDAMKCTCFQNSVDGDILLALHVVQVNPLHWDNMPCLPIEHCVVPILMKEGPKTLVGAPFLRRVVAIFLPESDNVPWINLVVVDLFPVGVFYQGPYLQTLKLFGRVGSGTTWWGVLGSGVLTKADGPFPLGKLLGVSNGSLA
jgi:hypothetical protein